ncbi:MAG: hypothetical protein JWN98_2155 [Abditibacteriota bacterium]|nr:hypothetical protein [Abditibacteriota bacterium]
MTSTKVLSSGQIEQFLTQGYLILHDCFSREFAQEWKERAWIRLGYDPDAPTTWEKGRIHMPAHQRAEVQSLAPQVWDAACDLLGGEERVQPGFSFSDAFIVNLRDGDDRPWQEPSRQTPGWHKDGDFFRHFLDSPEQGLLTLVIWSDIEPRGGGTFVARDSVPAVSRFLAQHPAGVLPNQFPTQELIDQCHDFIEVTGRTGDVVLLHPFMLHASSQNHLKVPRFLTNPPVHLKEPMQFNRTDAAYSPVEQAVLNALGVEHFDFQATGSREKVVPERVLRQRKMIEDEQARLAAANLA